VSDGSVLIIDGLIIFFLSIFFIQIIKKYARDLHLIDIPNVRSSHSSPTPTGAGIAFVLSFFLVVLFFHFNLFSQYFPFFIALFIVFALGVYDDIKGSSAKFKLLIIALAAVILFLFNGFEIKTLGNWFGYELGLPYVVSLVFTIFAVAGFTNALNLIDGLDGLAASVSFVIISALFYIGFIYNDQFIFITSFLVLMALLAFLIFNWNPASVFMGDSGSLSLGFIISALSIRAIDYISDTAILFIAAIPIIDTIIVMTRRIQRGISPFSPDKSHLHHKMVDLKKSIDGSVHIIVALQIILSAVGILLRDKRDFINLALFLIILFVFFHAFDSRKEQRATLLITKIKTYYTDNIKDKIRFDIVYFVGGILLLLFIIRFVMS